MPTSNHNLFWFEWEPTLCQINTIVNVADRSGDFFQKKLNFYSPITILQSIIPSREFKYTNKIHRNIVFCCTRNTETTCITLFRTSSTISQEQFYQISSYHTILTCCQSQQKQSPSHKRNVLKQATNNHKNRIFLMYVCMCVL